MCQNSIHMPTRKAKQGETVYSITDHGGAFAEKPDMGSRPYSGGRQAKRLVCVPFGQKVTLVNLQFRTTSGLLMDMVRKRGGTHVVTMTNHAGMKYGPNGDHFKFADGTYIYSHAVTSAIYIGELVQHKLFRGRKQFDAHMEKWPPSKKGVGIIKAAIREAIKTVPVEVDLNALRTKVRTTRAANGRFVAVGAAFDKVVGKLVRVGK